MGAAETKAGHEEEYVDGTSAAPWPQLDGVRPKTSPALDDRRSEDGEGRRGAKSNNIKNCSELLISTIRIADISNSNYGYRQYRQYYNCRYQQFELLISTIF